LKNQRSEFQQLYVLLYYMSVNVITLSVIGFPINSHNFALLSSILTWQQIVCLPWPKEYASIWKQFGHDGESELDG